jgi:hypothetical protein
VAADVIHDVSKVPWLNDEVDMIREGGILLHLMSF